MCSASYKPASCKMKRVFVYIGKIILNLTMDTEYNQYDKYADFYYTNLINAIVLFSMTKAELDQLGGPMFDPISELESEIDYAYTPVCFNTIFRNKLIDILLREELLEFKQQTDAIPSEIWNWKYIDSHATWIVIRQNANLLLDKLGITNRTYNDDFTTIYDSEGNIIKKGEKVPDTK